MKRWSASVLTILILVLVTWHFARIATHAPMPLRPASPDRDTVQLSSRPATVQARDIHAQKPRVVLYDDLRPGERYSADQIGHLFRVAGSLRLSEEEFDTLRTRYALMRTEIAQIETTRARVTQVDQSTIRVFIPSYPEEGRRFREEWNSFLVETIGAERAKAFAAEFPGAFEIRTANFGAASQEYTVTCTQAPADARRFFITKFATTLSTDTTSPSKTRESLSTLDCELHDTDGGEFSILKSHVEPLTPAVSDAEKMRHHP